MHPNLHLRLPHPPLPALLLSVVYAAAVAVALAHPGGHTLAGLAVLAGLTARWTLRHHRRTAAADAPARLTVVAAADGVVPDAAPAAAPAAA